MIAKNGKYKIFAMIGIPIMVLGMAIMVFMNSVPTAIISMIVFGFGVGFPVFSIAALNAGPYTEIGVATATLQLFRFLVGTIGIAIMGTDVIISKQPVEITGIKYTT